MTTRGYDLRNFLQNKAVFAPRSFGGQCANLRGEKRLQSNVVEVAVDAWLVQDRMPKNVTAWQQKSHRHRTTKGLGCHRCTRNCLISHITVYPRWPSSACKRDPGRTEDRSYCLTAGCPPSPQPPYLLRYPEHTVPFARYYSMLWTDMAREP
jgi:hypothetical protein